jgi:tRNA (cmo5U34)-methyltransferase
MMGSAAFGNIPLEKFVFMDSSEGMIGRAKERFRFPNAEFSVSDVRDLQYENEFDVITAIQVFHFLQAEERRTVLRQCHAALKENGILVSFENIAPFTETGKTVCLEKWRRFQMEQGKSREETEGHISRYGKDYFPITIEEHLRLLRESGFRVVEMLWFSNTQAGFWAMK